MIEEKVIILNKALIRLEDLVYRQTDMLLEEITRRNLTHKQPPVQSSSFCQDLPSHPIDFQVSTRIRAVFSHIDWSVEGLGTLRAVPDLRQRCTFLQNEVDVLQAEKSANEARLKTTEVYVSLINELRTENARLKELSTSKSTKSADDERLKQEIKTLRNKMNELQKENENLSAQLKHVCTPPSLSKRPHSVSSSTKVESTTPHKRSELNSEKDQNKQRGKTVSSGAKPERSKLMKVESQGSLVLTPKQHRKRALSSSDQLRDQRQSDINMSVLGKAILYQQHTNELLRTLDLPLA